MRHKLYAGVIALAVIGGTGFAVAQTGSGSGMSGSSSGSSSAQGSLTLTPAQQQSIRQGLVSQSSAPAPSGFQASVGAKLPDSLSAKPLPSNVQSQLAQPKQFLFVKLPDRILLADPDSKTIVAIIQGSESTGSGASTGGSSSSSGAGSGATSPGGSSSGGSTSPGSATPRTPAPGGGSGPGGMSPGGSSPGGSGSQQ